MNRLLTPKEAQETLLELREGVQRLRPALTAFSRARPVSERGREWQESLSRSVTQTLIVIDLLLKEAYAEPPVGKPVPQMPAGDARPSL